MNQRRGLSNVPVSDHAHIPAETPDGRVTN
jgi:hypothetical protein